MYFGVNDLVEYSAYGEAKSRGRITVVIKQGSIDCYIIQRYESKKKKYTSKSVIPEGAIFRLLPRINTT